MKDTVKKQISIILAPSWKFWISLEDRRGAIRNLGKLSQDDAIPAIPILINLLEQEDDYLIIREAIYILERIGSSKSEVESALINVFQGNTKSGSERHTALKALGSIKPSDKGIQVIASALSHHNTDTCFHSLEALDRLCFSHLEKLKESNDLAIPYLVNYAKQYRKGDCSRYERSIRILSKFGDKGLSALIELLNHFRVHSEIQASLSYRIAECLGSLGPSARSAVPALLDTLRDALQREDWQLLTKYYSDAIISIGYIDAVIDRYLQAKESTTPKFQENLSEILFQLADKQQLIDYLKDQDHIKNLAALEVLHLRWTKYRPIISGYEQEREEFFQQLIDIFYRNDKDNRLLVLKLFVFHLYYTDEFPEKIEHQIIELLDPIFTTSALDQKDSLCQAGCAGLLLLRTDHTKLISKIPHLLRQALMGEDKSISIIALSAISKASIQGEQGNTIVDYIVEYGETMTNSLDKGYVLDALGRIGPKANNSANFLLKTIRTALHKLEMNYRARGRIDLMPPSSTVSGDDYFFAAKAFYTLGKIRATKDITDKAFTMLKNSVWEKEGSGPVALHGIFSKEYANALKEEIEN